MIGFGTLQQKIHFNCTNINGLHMENFQSTHGFKELYPILIRKCLTLGGGNSLNNSKQLKLILEISRNTWNHSIFSQKNKKKAKRKTD